MKLNRKGFTLIELLAVITILGILMIVGIPAVQRTINNSRKDTFVDTAKEYANAVKTAWAADDIQCGDTTSGSISSGVEYVLFTTNADKFKTDSAKLNLGTDVTQAVANKDALIQSGGKSSFGNAEVAGYVKVDLSGTNPKYLIAIIDERGHGFAETDSDTVQRTAVLDPATVTLPSGVTYCKVVGTSTQNNG